LRSGLDLRASACLCVFSGWSWDKGRGERWCRSWGNEMFLKTGNTSSACGVAAILTVGHMRSHRRWRAE